jgi:hypothetical protein
MSKQTPAFKVGDLVQFGRGTVPHKVVAVTTTGRLVSYDLISQGGLSKGRRHQCIVERKLNAWEGLRR